jgi:TFIIH basal transcription factor complex TTD-A subunit
MILKYDEERHDYIVEDLDDENHLVIKESQLENLKVRLDQVSFKNLRCSATVTHTLGRILMRRLCSWMNPNLND